MKSFFEKQKNKLPFISLLLSAVLSFLIIQTSGFPYLGISKLFAVIAMFSFLFKPKKIAYHLILFIFILLFSLFFVLRVNPFLTLLNFGALVFLTALLIMPVGFGKSIVSVIFLPFLALLKTLTNSGAFVYRFDGVKQKKGLFEEHFPAIIITIFILFITIPLLSYANPFFKEFVDNVLNFFNVAKFFDDFYLYILRATLFIVLLFLLPRLTTVLLSDEPVQSEEKKELINFLIPKAVLSIVLVIFFITQTQLYFASPEMLQKFGYTNSRLTNEVFGQLSVVTGIIFLLAYLDNSRKTWRERLTYILLIEGFFLGAIALKSDMDYVEAFGFTHKRLYGFAILAWFFSAFGLYLHHYSKKAASNLFVPKIVFLTAGILLIVNAVNFDYMIYHYRKTTLPSGVDYHFLSRLSPDSASFKEQFETNYKIVKDKQTISYPEASPVMNVLGQIEYLQKKYKKLPSLGAVNLAELMEYNKVKDVNVSYYREVLNKKLYQPQPLPQPTPSSTSIPQ